MKFGTLTQQIIARFQWNFARESSLSQNFGNGTDAGVPQNVLVSAARYCSTIEDKHSCLIKYFVNEWERKPWRIVFARDGPIEDRFDWMRHNCEIFNFAERFSCAGTMCSTILQYTRTWLNAATYCCHYKPIKTPQSVKKHLYLAFCWILSSHSQWNRLIFIGKFHCCTCILLCRSSLNCW